MSNQYGTIYIAGIQLDLDPKNYKIYDGTRRGSIHRLVDGTSEFQDRGIDLSDVRIELSGELINLTTIYALQQQYVLIGNQMTYTDFKGNNWNVIFQPGVNSLTYEPILGSTRGYTYTIKLVIVSVNTNGWFGQAYP